jgi:hypothetical protein
MTRFILPVLLVLTTLACGVSTVPLSAVILPSPAPTASLSPTVPSAYDLIIVTVTDLYIRTGAGTNNSIVKVVPAGTTLYGEQCRADGWCWSAEQAGWFCAPAAVGAGCEE